MNIDLSMLETVFRLFLSIILGGVLGYEREVRKKPAGLRTHMMVALGSASFTIVIMEMAQTITEAGSRVDPTRVVEGIIGGIGFLGAGTIIQSRGSVEGITTAATIWVVGGVGLACGGGQYFLASATVFFAFVILTVFRWLEKPQ